MTIEQLRRHILTVASRKYVIKTEGYPPQVKYTHSFLEEFNTTAIVDSDTDKRLSQKEEEIVDDESTTVGDTTNLLKAFEGFPNLLETSPEEDRKLPAKPKPSQTKPKPPPTMDPTSTTTASEKIPSFNLISPPATIVSPKGFRKSYLLHY
jgi:hypothetical protein